MTTHMGTTESLRTSENTEPLEEFSLAISFPGNSVAPVLPSTSVVDQFLCQKTDFPMSTLTGKGLISPTGICLIAQGWHTVPTLGIA